MAKTYREIIYIIQDEMRILSDDSIFETDHFVFLANKYRALLFNQKYKGKKIEIPFAWYQRLNVAFTTKITGTNVYKSTKKIPQILDITDLWKYTFVSEGGMITNSMNFINPFKFKFTGFNKWIASQKYVTIDLDNYMYIKKSAVTTSQILYYDTILDNPIDADRFNDTNTLDVLDLEFPCEESLIQPIIDLCLKEIGIINNITRDTTNNASDDASLPKQ